MTLQILKSKTVERSCRYQGNADIVLYGNQGDHQEDNVAGYKYIHVAQGGVLEMHGKEKRPFSTLQVSFSRKNI